MIRVFGIAVAALALLALTSCTRVFAVTVSLVDGTLTFQSRDNRATNYPWCWREFMVASEDGSAAWSFEVPYGAYQGSDPCGPNFPLRYGQPPARAETTIAPARLEPGRLYVIRGHSAGLLEGAFRLARDGERIVVQNVDPRSSEAMQAVERHYAWQRSRDTMGTGRIIGEAAQHEPLEQPPATIPRRAEAGRAGADDYTWLLNTSDRSSFPSLSYASLDARDIRFDLWCRWRGSVILGRMRDVGRAGSPLDLASGPHELVTTLHHSREPDGGFPVSGVLSENDPLLRRFGTTGELSMRIGGETLEMNAIDARERQTVRRFFELCYFERPNEPDLPWRE